MPTATANPEELETERLRISEEMAKLNRAIDRLHDMSFEHLTRVEQSGFDRALGELRTVARSLAERYEGLCAAAIRGAR